MWRYAGYGFLVGIPITITFSDIVGSVSTVDGVSMQPVLNPNAKPNKSSQKKNNDVVLINKWSTHGAKYNRGEIVTLRSPRCVKENQIKRLIALEGDLIKTNGYIKKYIRIPKGHCWVEGENRKYSIDSNSYGPVPIALLYGKATHIIFPPGRFKRLEKQFNPSRILTVDEFEKTQTSNVDVESDCDEVSISN